MNTTVTASNMQVKAVADQGILINVEKDDDSAYWTNTVTTNQSTGILLHATSTANTSAWYVAHSKVTGDAAHATAASTQSGNLVDGYHTLGTSPYLTATETVAKSASDHYAQQDITYVDTGASGYTNGEGYYVKYTYYLKSSAEAITTSLAQNGQNLNITATVTDTTSPATSADLDKALRVAVVINGKAYIFAPVSGADTTYYVAAGATLTTALTGTQPTDVLTIPAVTSDGIEVNVYLYFEGEDQNLKTDNALAALDNLTVSVSFSLVKNAAVIDPAPGVAIP